MWNNLPEEKEECEEYPDEENRSKSPASEASLVGYEIAPGIGSVIPNNNEDTAEQFKMNNLNIDVGNSDAATKKVNVQSEQTITKRSLLERTNGCVFVAGI